MASITAYGDGLTKKFGIPTNSGEVVVTVDGVSVTPANVQQDFVLFSTAPAFGTVIVIDYATAASGGSGADVQVTNFPATQPVSGPLTNTQLRAAAVPVSGALTDTELRATALPVSASALPLPSGASTAAAQGTANASLASIDGKTPALVSGRVPTVSAGYDAADDMMKVKSVQKKWRDSFTRPITEVWDLTQSGGSTATSSGGVLTIASGTTAGGFVEMLSKETFTIPFRAMFGVLNTRHASNHQIIEAVSVDATTGIPDGRHCVQMDIGGAASVTATQMLYYVQNGGLAPLASSAATIVTTASYSILELEPFADEAYFHSRTLDATTGRTNSYVRHQQIPDPSAVYKLRIRSMNHAAWRSITGAVAGTGGVIRLTSTAHGYTGTPNVWVESLNGVLNGTAEVRGNYAISVVDANTIELTGTTFAGAYVTGSGRVALAAAPTAVNVQFQFANCQDYAELTAEITAGRGQGVEGQAIGARLVASTAAIGSVTLTSGTVTAVTTAGTPAVPATPYFVNSLATTNGALVLTGTSGVQAFFASNTGAAAAYVKLYNKATAPTVGTDVPEMIVPVPAAVGGVPGVVELTPGFNGYRFPLGLGIAITGGAADADTTAVAAGQVKVKLSRTV